MPIRILNVVGARPNFVKIAALLSAYRGTAIQPLLVHTGQHYDPALSERFFHDLQIPPPDVHLKVARGTCSRQTAAIISAFEPVVLEHKPDAVLVVGDVTSTLACALVAARLRVPLVHVEAGLRSFDRSMPEEINRIVTDSLSDLLFCTEQSAVENLRRERITPERVHLVGNVMIDTLLRCRERAEQSDILRTLDLAPGRFALLTLHRPGNVDDIPVITRLLDAIDRISRRLPIVFPVHPRTRRVLETPALAEKVARIAKLKLIPPAGYLDFIKLASSARLILTDSGGVQEEATVLRIPCLTLRPNTERPSTVESGGNRVTGNDPEAIYDAVEEYLTTAAPPIHPPPLWDGNAARRIVQILLRHF